MNDQTFRSLLAQETPEVPDTFHLAMTTTLGSIVAQELNGRADTPKRSVLRGARRSLVIALMIVMLLAAAAVAAYHWQIFDNVWFFKAPVQNADEVMQTVLHQETVNGVDITINEAGYDGRTLYLMYTYRMPDVDTPLGMYRDGQTGAGVSEEDLQLLSDHGVGWWTDTLWINGEPMGMAVNSGSEMSGSPTPGELLVYEYWRLDNEGVTLSGETEISLPIGRRPQERATMLTNPELFNENGDRLLPDEGVVTFTVDVSDMLDRVVTTHPNLETVTPEVTLKVSEASFTPLMTYITLSMEPDPDVLAAFVAENGEGWYDDNGSLLFPYSGMDIYGGWVSSLRLVDENGADLFPDEYGNNGFGETWAEFLWPYKEDLPETLWLAPVEGGAADWSRAVRVR